MRVFSCVLNSVDVHPFLRKVVIEAFTPASKLSVMSRKPETRLPLVASTPSEIEKEYFDLLRQREYEKSVLSLWEVEQNRQTEIMHAVEIGDKDPQDIDFKAMNQDIEDENEAVFKEFVESIREHPDYDNNMRNISRKMHESLVYIVKKKLGNDEVWLLPGEPLCEAETMRECAERALSSHQSRDFHATIFSNAPSSFYKYKFPKGVRLKSDEDGAKTFIYSAIAKRAPDSLSVEGFSKAAPAELEDQATLDYAWVTIDEMKERLKPKYFEAVRKILW